MRFGGFGAFGFGFGIPLLSSGGGGPAPVVMDPAPATFAGMTGNNVTYPQDTLLKGPNSNLRAISTVASNGDQIVIILNQATGAEVERRTIYTGRAYDDHNNNAVVALDDGSLIACCTGHNTDTVFTTAIRDAAGNWTQSNITLSSEGTYPHIFVENSGLIRAFVRVANATWTTFTKANAGAAWSAAQNYLSDTLQAYSTIRYDPANNRYLMACRYNNTDGPALGIRLVRLDATTLEFRDGAGGLGFLGGGASGNGKTLPFKVVDVADTFPKPTEKRQTVLDFMGDRLLITEVWTAGTRNLDDRPIFVYTLSPGADPTLEASWLKSPIITNANGTMSTDSNYQLTGAFDRAPVTDAISLFLMRLDGTFFRQEQWRGSLDLKVWYGKSLQTTVATPTTGTTTKTNVLSRCVSPEGAKLSSPVSASFVASFNDYNVYSGAEQRFVQPSRNDPWAPHAETTAWLARLTNQPNAGWANLYDRVVHHLKAASFYTPLDGFYFLGAHHIQASKENLISASYTPSQQGGLPDASFTAGQGWIGNGSSHWLDTGFDPSSAVGRQWAQNSAHLGVYIRTEGQDAAPEIGNANNSLISRNASNVMVGRISNGTGTNSSTNNQTQGHVMVSRHSSTQGRMFRRGISLFTGTWTTSAAPASGSIGILTRNGAGIYNGRRLAFAHFGAQLGSSDITGLMISNIGEMFAIEAANL